MPADRSISGRVLGLVEFWSSGLTVSSEARRELQNEPFDLKDRSLYGKQRETDDFPSTLLGVFQPLLGCIWGAKRQQN